MLAADVHGAEALVLACGGMADVARAVSAAVGVPVCDGVSFGAMLAFEVDGGRAAGEAVMDRVRLCLRATSLGGAETCVSHPASTSHRQLSEEELEAAGIRPGDLRLTVGIEDADDLIEDLDQALR